MMMKTVADTSKTALFQMRINPCVRKRVEAVYADCGLTLTDAINLFLQQSLNVEGLPFTVTSKPKTAKFDQAVGRLVSEINAGVESAEREGWIPEGDVLSEFGVAI